jgi:hypothetical protein
VGDRNCPGSTFVKRLPSLLAVGYIAYAAVTLGFVGQFVWRVWRAQVASAEEVPLRSWLPLATFVFLALVLIAVFVYLGILLFQRRRRRVALVLAAVSCLGIPVGTLLGGLTIYALTRAEIISEFPPTA